MQGQFFSDADTGSAEHDAVCYRLSLEDNAKRLIRLIFSHVPHNLIIESEKPIFAPGGFLIGYAEIIYKYQDCQGTDHHYLIEVKETFDNPGTTLRQLRTFKALLNEPFTLVLFTTDEMFEKASQSQYSKAMETAGVYMLSMERIRTLIKNAEAAYDLILDGQNQTVLLPPHDIYEGRLHSPKLVLNRVVNVLLWVEWKEIGHWDTPTIGCEIALEYAVDNPKLDTVLYQLDYSNLDEFTQWHQTDPYAKLEKIQNQDYAKEYEYLRNVDIEELEIPSSDVSVILKLVRNAAELSLRVFNNWYEIKPDKAQVVSGSFKVVKVEGVDDDEDYDDETYEDDVDDEDEEIIIDDDDEL